MNQHDPFWGPLERALRAAPVVIGHAFLVLVFLGCNWILDLALHTFRGEAEPLLYGRVPLRWMFDTMDVALLLVFIGWAVVDVHRKLKG